MIYPRLRLLWACSVCGFEGDHDRLRFHRAATTLAWPGRPVEPGAVVAIRNHHAPGTYSTAIVTTSWVKRDHEIAYRLDRFVPFKDADCFLEDEVGMVATASELLTDIEMSARRDGMHERLWRHEQAGG